MTIEGTVQLYNNIGTLAANDSVVSLSVNIIGLNQYGVVVRNSLPLVIGNVISDNSANGMNITGSYLGTGTCEVEFTNSSIFNYSSCVALNYVTLNGASGLGMSNLNDSFVYQNGAVGNTLDGFNFVNLTSSLIEGQISITNGNNGITMSDSIGNMFSVNEVGGNLNGIVFSGSSNNTVDSNYAAFNALDGILFSSASGNTVSNNNASQNAADCSRLLSCTVAAGIELFNSSGNIVFSNILANNTALSGTGDGLYMSAGSSDNFAFLNNATLNYAGIGISSSSANSLVKNSLYSNTYGVYLLDAPGNTITNNNFGRNKQSVYPNQPSVSFANIVNGTTYTGTVNLVWTTSGQAISKENLIIDGKSQTVSGTSFELNSAILSDGVHTLTIQVVNTGGLSASSTIEISTKNHQGLTVVALGPSGVPLTRLQITLTGSSGSMNSTTDSTGSAIFTNLSSGTYIASALVNGTLVSMPVNFQGNSTVTLYAQTLVTTATVPIKSGGSVPIQITGNILASQLSDLQLVNNHGDYNLTFAISALNGTVGQATIMIPKSSIPTGLVPKVLINGIPAETQSYNASGNYYIVTFLATLSSHTNVTIQFARIATYSLDIVIAVVVVVALLAAGLVLAFRRPKPSFYAPAPF